MRKSTRSYADAKKIGGPNISSDERIVSQRARVGKLPSGKQYQVIKSDVAGRDHRGKRFTYDASVSRVNSPGKTVNRVRFNMGLFGSKETAVKRVGRGYEATRSTLVQRSLGGKATKTAPTRKLRLEE